MTADPRRRALTLAAVTAAGLLLAGGLWLWARWGMAVVLSDGAWLCLPR